MTKLALDQVVIQATSRLHWPTGLSNPLSLLPVLLFYLIGSEMAFSSCVSTTEASITSQSRTNTRYH